MQIAIDRYYLNKSLFPTVQQPAAGNPEKIDWTQLEGSYLNKTPKDTTQLNWWVDFSGKVWVADIGIPQNISVQDNGNNTYTVNWDGVQGAILYRVGYIEDTTDQYVWLTETNNTTVDINQDLSGKTVVVTAVSENYLETAPASGSATIQTDITPPTATITETDNGNNTVTLTITATDNESGVKQIMLPDATWVVGSIAQFIVTTNGDYIFMVEDNAGNIATFTYTVSSLGLTQQTITVQVADGANDGHVCVYNSFISTTATFLNVRVSDFNSNERWDSFIKFDNINIPQGANIVSAYLEYNSNSSSLFPTTVYTRLYLNKTANPVVPSTVADYQNLALTTNSVDWDIQLTSTPLGTIQSQDISLLIQEIVNMPEWQSGNSIMVVHKIVYKGSTGGITIDSYESNPHTAPKLVIIYE